MKRKTTINNAKLGIFVLAGVLFLVFSLYMIGRNRNLFGATFTLSAYFRNINGLVAGNNVRFSGIDVGTVESISVENDTSILVVMIVDLKMRKHIKTNAVASIGTDGLVGNKLVNINSTGGHSVAVADGSVISSRLGVETDEMLRTLQTTNGNIAVITENLKEVSVRLNESSTLWEILADTVLVRDLKSAVAHLDRAGANTEVATADARMIVTRLSTGDGLVNSMFTDSVLRNSVTHSINDLKRTSASLETASSRLKEVATGIQDGKGVAGVLLTDTATSLKLKQSIINIEEGTGRFSENMEALKTNILFRKYFRRRNGAAKSK